MSLVVVFLALGVVNGVVAFTESSGWLWLFAASYTTAAAVLVVFYWRDTH